MTRGACAPLLLALLLAGCAGSLSPTGVGPGALSSAASNSSSATTVSAGPATVQIANSASLGEILTDSDGRTLYLNTGDANDTSTCNGSCASQWLPLTAPGGKPSAGPGVTGTLDVFTRSDGIVQVAINGAPLYLDVSDHGPGDVSGQGIDHVWYAVQPNGAAAESSAAVSAAAATVQVVDNPTYGPMLVDSAGMTLYLYTKDVAGLSLCTGTCGENWRPLIPAGTPTAGPGVTGKLSFFTRADGTKQVSINGQPLYLYANDAGAGDTTGQGFANDWFVVKPSGAEIG